MSHSILTVILLALSTIAGCAVETEQDATGLLRNYFVAVQGGADDRGWSFLHPVTRRDMFRDDQQAYVEAAAAADWTGFDWHITDTWEDDEGLFRLVLTLDGDVPRFLTEAHNHLRLVPASGAPEMAVRYGLGGSGIWAIGG